MRHWRWRALAYALSGMPDGGGTQRQRKTASSVALRVRAACCRGRAMVAASFRTAGKMISCRTLRLLWRSSCAFSRVSIWMRSRALLPGLAEYRIGA